MNCHCMHINVYCIAGQPVTPFCAQFAQTLWPRTHIPVWHQLWSRVHAANRLPHAQRQREFADAAAAGVPYRQRVERFLGIGNSLVPERVDYHDTDGRLTRDTNAVEIYGACRVPDA